MPIFQSAAREVEMDNHKCLRISCVAPSGAPGCWLPSSEPLPIWRLGDDREAI